MGSKAGVARSARRPRVDGGSAGAANGKQTGVADSVNTRPIQGGRVGSVNENFAL